MTTATLGAYKPEQLVGFKVNGVKPTDVVTYFEPWIEPGQFFVIVRAADNSNPRTLVLTRAQLDTLPKRLIARIPTVAAKVATIFAFLLSAGVTLPAPVECGQISFPLTLHTRPQSWHLRQASPLLTLANCIRPLHARQSAKISTVFSPITIGSF